MAFWRTQAAVLARLRSLTSWRPREHARLKQPRAPPLPCPEGRPASPGPGEQGRSTIHVRRGQPVRHVRLQTFRRPPNGQKFDPGGKVELFQSEPGAVMASPWKWRQFGQCGQWVSDLLPHLARCVDDIAFLPAMVAKSNVHGPATFMQNTGFVLPGFPSMGAWVSYGLGDLSQNLPSFVVLPDSRGFAPNGPRTGPPVFCPPRIKGRWCAPAPGTRSSTSSRRGLPQLTPEAQSEGLALLNA